MVNRKTLETSKTKPQFRDFLVRSWMAQELNLRATSLLVYAKIYEDTEEEGGCTLEFDDFAALLGVRRTGIINVVYKLRSLGLIDMSSGRFTATDIGFQVANGQHIDPSCLLYQNAYKLANETEEGTADDTH